MIADPLLTLAEIERRLTEAGFPAHRIDVYLDLVSGARNVIKGQGPWPMPGIRKPS